MKLFTKIAVLIAVLFVVLRSCGPFLVGRNSLIDQPAPDFILETLSGQKESMSRFRNDQPALIFFWATWCPHCRTQLKELTQQRQEIEERGIKVILVDVGEDSREVAAYVNDYNIPFDVFLDQDTTVSNEYKVVGVPTFFFLSKEGIVVAVEHFLPENYEEILLGAVL